MKILHAEEAMSRLGHQDYMRAIKDDALIRRDSKARCKGAEARVRRQLARDRNKAKRIEIVCYTNKNSYGIRISLTQGRDTHRLAFRSLHTYLLFLKATPTQILMSENLPVFGDFEELRTRIQCLKNKIRKESTKSGLLVSCA